MEETTRLNSIVTDFLDFARPTTPHLSECQVDKVLEKNLEFLEVELERRDITVEKRFAENGTPVFADGDLLYRAFLNIFVNAMEALDDGGTIKVVTRYQDTQENSLEVIISDTGAGISQEALANIFDPFFTTRETGTGLGLPIVRNIIESHGGTVQIESPPKKERAQVEDRGTAIIISLPVNPVVS
jgi:signal transduction histidine kinase